MLCYAMLCNTSVILKSELGPAVVQLQGTSAPPWCLQLYMYCTVYRSTVTIDFSQIGEPPHRQLSIYSERAPLPIASAIASAGSGRREPRDFLSRERAVARENHFARATHVAT